MNIKKYFISIALVFGIVIIVNVLSDDLFIRFDFTDNNQYTLSEATGNLLKNLEEPITVQAYFSQDLPPNIASVRRDFKDLLIEYANRSNGKFVYDIKDPNSEEAIEREAVQNGVQPVLINVREKDQVKQQKAFLGAVIKMGELKEVIPFMQPGLPMEYALSSAIKKISVKDKTVIGLIQGQGEVNMEEMPQVQSELDVLYQIQNIRLSDTSRIPENIQTLALIRPMDSLSQNKLEILDDFLNRGGNLLIAIDRVNADLQTLYGSAQNTGVESWLAQKGIQVKPSFVVDAHCGNVSVQQQQGMFRYMTQIQFPYIPMISKFADHPVVQGLENVIMPFVSPIEYTGDSSMTFIPLAFSSDKSSEQNAPVMINVQKKWSQNDFNKPNLIVAAALINHKSNGKMLVISNGSFAVGGADNRQQVQGDNVSLLVNGIDWLSDDTGLIGLRTKGITSRPIEELSDSSKAILKYANFLIPIFLILIIGLVRMQRNKNIRIKRKEENYG
jgi:gliding-associated putative ABC transporter substrate-binding component GldG